MDSEEAVCVVLAVVMVLLYAGSFVVPLVVAIWMLLAAGGLAVLLMAYVFYKMLDE